jgi:rRNA-processing protein FCF1/predicted RNA-binding Zn-ribbon protein involved in translation (DUF1610 family)
LSKEGLLAIDEMIDGLSLVLNDEHWLSLFKEGSGCIIPAWIKDRLEDVLHLCYDDYYCKKYRMNEKYKKKIDTLAVIMWKFACELDYGLKWAENYERKNLLWLAAIESKHSDPGSDYDFFGDKIIDDAQRIIVESDRKVITTNDILIASKMELKDFIAKLYKNARFICPKCLNNKILRLPFYKTQQGIILSCPKCREKFTSQLLNLNTTFTQNLFILDTSAIIQGIVFDMIKQHILEKPSIIVPRAVQFELQRMIKSGKKKEGKTGLLELTKLRELADNNNITFSIEGEEPSLEEVQISEKTHIGIDRIIIKMAKEYSGTIITSDDEDLSGLAENEGIRCLVCKSH